MYLGAYAISGLLAYDGSSWSLTVVDPSLPAWTVSFHDVCVSFGTVNNLSMIKRPFPGDLRLQESFSETLSCRWAPSIFFLPAVYNCRHSMYHLMLATKESVLQARLQTQVMKGIIQTANSLMAKCAALLTCYSTSTCAECMSHGPNCGWCAPFGSQRKLSIRIISLK